MRGGNLVINLMPLIFCIFFEGGTLVESAGINGLIKSPGTISDTVKLNSLIRKGMYFLNQPSPDLQKTETFIDSAYTFCEKNNIDQPPSLHLLRAEYFLKTGDYSRSEEEAKKSLQKAKDSDADMVLARTMVFLGRYFLRTGFYKESMDYFGNAVTLSEKKELSGIIPKSYLGQAYVFNAINDLNGYRKALEMMIYASLAENDSVSAQDGFLKLGTSLTDMDRDFRKADSLLRRCLEISLIRRDTFFTAYASANIGWNYYTVRMYDSSLFYYKQSLRYSIPGRQYATSANSLGNIGTIYRDLGRYEEALGFYRKSVDQATLANDWYSLSWVYNDMSELFLRNRDTSGAYTSYKLYKQFSDSVIISRNTQGMIDARARYEADNHNKAVEVLSLRLKNQRLLNYGFTALILLTFIIGLLLFRGARLEAERRISEMNRRIAELTQVNLRQQMNPHFIFNTLNSIQYYMYQHDKLATNNYLTKFSSLIRKVLENSHHTSIPLRDELDALKLYLDLECLRFKDKFDYEIKVDEEIDTLLFKVPAMLIQPYVENSICHGLMPKTEKGSVIIEMKMGEDCIKCTIEDNGVGREAAEERKKQNETGYNSLGTQIVSSRLELVNSLYGSNLGIIYTDLKNEKGEPVGTRVELHIPLMT